MVTPLRDVLKAQARAWGIERAAHLAAVRSAWPSVVGAVLAEVAAPVTLRGTCLFVGVTHTAAAQEIRLRGSAIVRALAQQVGPGVVTEVRPVPRQRLRK